MKIAIVDHVVNQGGGSRVLRCLLPAIKRLRPAWQMVFYSNRQAAKREGLDREFSDFGIQIESLKSVKLANTAFLGIKSSKTIISFIQMRYQKALSYFPLYFSGAIHREFAQIAKKHDVLFCPWPYLVKCPDVSIPIVAIFHDFCYQYYFNGPIYQSFQREELQKEIPKWLKASIPVVSTHFMKAELSKFYPEFASKAEIIHLSSLGAQTQIEFSEAKKVVSELGIAEPYLLYPTNTCSRKNIGNLVSAFYLLKKKYPRLKLVFAGFGTEELNGTAFSLGLEIGGARERDVRGLGYVSNVQIDALIQCASVVISTSLYEAGCGPGLDAWFRAVPVAMSNIPPFTEHMQVQDVRAQVFDPKSPADIAEKIDVLLSDPEQAKKDAIHSQKRLAQYDWEQVAKKYVAVFEKCGS